MLTEEYSLLHLEVRGLNPVLTVSCSVPIMSIPNARLFVREDNALVGLTEKTITYAVPTARSSTIPKIIRVVMVMFVILIMVIIVIMIIIIVIIKCTEIEIIIIMVSSTP